MDAPTIPTQQLALVACVLFVSYTIVTLFIIPIFSTQEKFWRSQSWIGDKNKTFARFRAGFASITNTKDVILEGYAKFGKKAFMLPQFSNDPLLVVSGDQLHELLMRPDSDLDPTIPNGDMININRTMRETVDSPHMDIVRKQLTRRLPILTYDIFEELTIAMNTHWKAKADWTTINIHPTNMIIVSQAANRVFAGAELCRDLEFLEHSRLYSVKIFTAGALYKIMPKWLHPFAAPLLQYPINKSAGICKKHCEPIIIKRMEKLRTDPSYELPQDGLSWLIEQSLELSKTDPDELARGRDLICHRLLALNMVAIHTTSIVMTNTMLDLYTSPRREEFLAGLREECTRVLAESGGKWTKDAVNKLYRVDSALRESLRFQSLGEIVLRRLVVNPNGLDLDDGTHIPRGVTLVAPAAAIHNDKDFYPGGHEWDAFRFSRPREEYMAKVKSSGGAQKDEILQQKNQSLIAYSEEFLGFGHGRHACPGRFFASQEMKLMLAHTVLTYDIKVEGSRPANMSINGSAVPRDNFKMQVRQRVQE